MDYFHTLVSEVYDHFSYSHGKVLHKSGGGGNPTPILLTYYYSRYLAQQD